MTTALMEKPETTPALPKDQVDLIRRTVAKDATNDELALFLYDCARRGVHPLDKLLHFTKRGGRYTPVTSIDFMRSQAAMSGEMAGSDDPAFLNDPNGRPEAATVTVYRMTQGQRFPYTATARFAEYCPDNAPMWKRMPHTMLGKCAEALALRKAFPQQLAGLYSREEMDQAGEPQGYTVTPPAPVRSVRENAASPPAGETRALPVAASSNGRTPDFGSGDAGSTPAAAATDEGPDLGVDLPHGFVLIRRVDKTRTKNATVNRYLVTFSDGVEASTIKEPLASTCEQHCQNRVPVIATIEQNGRWTNLIGVMSKQDVDSTKWHDDSHSDPVDPNNTPF